MSNFIVPNTFVPGTKAKAQEVNENFSAVREELNLKAEKSGNINQQFLVASATEDNHAITKKQVNDLIQEYVDDTKSELLKEMKTPLSIESAYLDENGDLLILNGENSILSFNVDEGTNYKPIVAISSQCESKIVITNLGSINISSYTDGTYNVFANEDSAYLLNNTIFSQKKKPLNPSLNCIFEDISKLPVTFEKYNGTKWVPFEDIFLGSIVVNSGVISKVNNIKLSNKWSKMSATELSTANSLRPAVIIENYINGNSWYRVYSDGWCEQGGKAGNTQASNNRSLITLLKHYRDTSFSITASTSGGAYQTERLWRSENPTSPDFFYVRLVHSGSETNGALCCCWTTAGYLAEGEY